MNRRSFIKKLGLLSLVPFVPTVFFESMGPDLGNFQKLRDHNIREICRAFNVPPHRCYPETHVRFVHSETVFKFGSAVNKSHGKNKSPFVKLASR